LGMEYSVNRWLRLGNPEIQGIFGAGYGLK